MDNIGVVQHPEQKKKERINNTTELSARGFFRTRH